MSPTNDGSETLTSDANGKIPIICISNRLPKASGFPGPLGSPWRQNMQRRDHDWMLLRAPSRRLGNFAAEWMLSMLSEDCQNIRKAKSCDLCNFQKLECMWFWYYCISVTFLCISAKQHRKQTLYPICPELSGTGQPVHRAKIVLPKELHSEASKPLDIWNHISPTWIKLKVSHMIDLCEPCHLTSCANIFYIILL